MKKVLVMGSGGREHAICDALRKDSNVDVVFCAPGNGGTEAEDGVENLEYKNVEDLRRKIGDNSVELVVIGPEGPLAEGVSDYLRTDDLPVVGFGKKAARLESSKVFADRFKKRHVVSSPDFEVFSDLDSASEYLRKRFDSESTLTLWIKADELCGGKGAIGVSSYQEGRETLHQLLEEKKCGKGERVVIQEDLEGEEVTVQAITDGHDFTLAPPSQDHKPIYEGGKGPNTGGMGAYAPAPMFDSTVEDNFTRDVLAPTFSGIGSEDLRSPGVLYFGLMVGADNEPRVLEYNVRFGDPEAQAVLPLLDYEFYPLMHESARGGLSGILDKVSWKDRACVCVVVAVEGYPVDYGDEHHRIEGLNEAEAQEGVKIYHAGTSLEGGNFYTAGGRVVGITATGEDLEEARDKAYAGVERINFSGMQFRRDIASSAL